MCFPKSAMDPEITTNCTPDPSGTMYLTLETFLFIWAKLFLTTKFPSCYGFIYFTVYYPIQVLFKTSLTQPN